VGIKEPRFLLEKDSICYGCPEYKHISETDIQVHLGDIDNNGGVCDTEKPCFAGCRNTYEEKSVWSHYIDRFMTVN